MKLSENLIDMSVKIYFYSVNWWMNGTVTENIANADSIHIFKRLCISRECS